MICWFLEQQTGRHRRLWRSIDPLKLLIEVWKIPSCHQLSKQLWMIYLVVTEGTRLRREKPNEQILSRDERLHRMKIVLMTCLMVTRAIVGNSDTFHWFLSFKRRPNEKAAFPQYQQPLQRRPS